MKRPSALFICGTVVITLIAFGYLAVYMSLLKQAQKLTQLEVQTQIIFDTQMKLHKNLVKLDSGLKELKTANRGEIEEILSRVDGITGKIQSWKEEYNAFLSNIKEDINNLTKVDLGKVEVEKENE